MVCKVAFILQKNLTINLIDAFLHLKENLHPINQMISVLKENDGLTNLILIVTTTKIKKTNSIFM